MNYPQDNKTSKKINIKTLLTVVIILAVIYFLGGAIFRMVSSEIVFISTPVLNLGTMIKNSTNANLSFFTSKKVLYEENESLKREIEATKLRLLGVEEMRKENNDLKKTLGRSTDENIVLASVLSRPYLLAYDYIIIDAGEKLNIKNGNLVMADGGVVIGTVIKVYSNSSKVELFSTPGKYMNAFLGSEHIPISVKGNGGGNFEFKLPRETTVNIGDIISIPNINIKIFGTVEYIKEEPSNPFRTVLFKSPVNANKIKWVQVLKN